MNLNKVFILGRLTADPQLRTTSTGTQVATFSVATNRMWTDKAGQKQTSVEYHNVILWGRQAEIASKFLVKGALVLVEGRLQTRTWEDKQGGKRKTTEIIGERLQLGPRATGGPAQAGVGKTAPEEGDMSEKTAGKVEELPTITIDDEDIKPEDLPF